MRPVRAKHCCEIAVAAPERSQTLCAQCVEAPTPGAGTLGWAMHQPERNLASFLKQWIPYQAGGGYRYFTGSLAFVLHRVSGIALIVYLFLHIASITKAGQADPSQYDVVMRRFQEPDFKIGEIALWAAVLFHGINGIRILLVDFVFERSHVSKSLFWWFAVVILILLVVGSIPLILHSNVQPLLYEGGH